nr:uncharacterized protein LOC113811046 [Penaeus vannamei]
MDALSLSSSPWESSSPHTRCFRLAGIRRPARVALKPLSRSPGCRRECPCLRRRIKPCLYVRGRNSTCCGAVVAVSSGNLSDPRSVPAPPVDGNPGRSLHMGSFRSKKKQTACRTKNNY